MRIQAFSSMPFRGHVNVNWEKTNAAINAYRHLDEQREALRLNVDNFVKTVERETPDSHVYNFELEKGGSNTFTYARVQQEQGEEGEELLRQSKSITMYGNGQYASGESIYKSAFRPLIYSTTHNGSHRVEVENNISPKNFKADDILKKVSEIIESEIPDDTRIRIEAKKDLGETGMYRTKLVLNVKDVSVDNDPKVVGVYKLELCPHGVTEEERQINQKNFINNTAFSVISKYKPNYKVEVAPYGSIARSLWPYSMQSTDMRELDNMTSGIIERIASGIASQLPDFEKVKITARGEKCLERIGMDLGRVPTLIINFEDVSDGENKRRFNTASLQLDVTPYFWPSAKKQKAFIDNTVSSVLEKYGINNKLDNKNGLISERHCYDPDLKQIQGDRKISFSDNNEDALRYWRYNKDQYEAIKGNVESLAQKLNDETPSYEKYKISLLNLYDASNNTTYLSVAVQNVNDGSVTEQRIPVSRPPEYSWENRYVSGEEIWEKGFKPLCERLGLSC